MRKQIFFLAVAAIAMASCSQDETIGINEGKGIGFRTSADNLTRGAEITTNSIEDFYVTAFDKDGGKYFEDAKFSKEQGSTGNIFVSDPLYYWPGDGSTLTFRAYAPAKTDIGGTMSYSLSSGNTLTGFSPAAEINDQVDLIYATATGSKANEASGVQLDFKHMLSQIEIKAKNDNEGYTYEVVGVRIAKPVSKGTLDFDKAMNDTEKANAWTPGTDKATYDVTYTTPIILDGTAKTLMSKKDDNAMLIPQKLTAWDGDKDGNNSAQGAYLAVKVKITTASGAQVYPWKDGETYGWAAVGIGTEWKMGNKYIYTLDFSDGAGKVDPTDPDDGGKDILGGPIKFTVDVATWEPLHNEEVELGKDGEGAQGE